MDFDDLPDSWININLGEFFDKLQYGYTASASEKNDKIKLLRITDLQDRLVNWENVPGCEISDNDYKKYQLENGDFVFARTGSIEKAWMVKDVPNAVFASYLIRGKPLLPSISPWLNKFIETLDYLVQIRDLSAGIGRSNVNAQNLSKVIVPLAPLNEQKRIVEKIELIQEHTRKVKSELDNIKVKLKRLRRSLLASAFRGDLTKDWRADHPDIESATVLLERIKKERREKWEQAELEKMRVKGITPKDDKWKSKYSEPQSVKNIDDLPNIPDGWCWVNLEQLSEIVRGASPRPAGDPKYFGGNIPWITVGSLTADNQPYLTSVNEFLTEEGKTKSRYIQPDTLLLTNSGATLGVPKITKIGGCINDGSVALLYVDYPLKLYLYYFLSSITQKLRSINQGAAQPNLNTGIVKDIQLKLPSLEEQKEIVRKLEKMMQFADRVEERVKEAEEKLDKFNQSVLAKAFRGKLVPQDPNDEPASVLLGKIQQEKNSTTSKKIKK